MFQKTSIVSCSYSHMFDPQFWTLTRGVALCHPPILLENIHIPWKTTVGRGSFPFVMVPFEKGAMLNCGSLDFFLRLQWMTMLYPYSQGKWSDGLVNYKVITPLNSYPPLTACLSRSPVAEIRLTSSSICQTHALSGFKSIGHTWLTKKQEKSNGSYCWWEKSCTTWDV